MKKTVTLLLALLIATATFSTPPSYANFVPVNVPEHSIEIMADGNVTGTDKIRRDESVYTFTGNISGSIVVLRDNITIDGAGYVLQGNGYLYGIFIQDASGINGSGVTIKNLTITDFETGVLYSYYHGSDKVVVLSGNTIKNNSRGIVCYNTNNLIVSENKIINNDFGIRSFIAQGIVVCGNFISDNHIAVQFESSFNNSVYGNNFINNTYHAILDSTVSWNNGTSGNFWSDYDGTDADGDGIGDTPYVIDENNQDSYPLTTPYQEPEPTPEPQKPEPLQTTLVIASIATVAVIAASLLIAFKKRKR